MVVRRIRTEEWKQLKELRLRALSRAPEAFCSTFEEASRLSDPIWEERARMGAESERSATFVALEQERLVGMTVVTLDQQRAEITAVYLDDEARGQGLASQMLRQALDFAGPIEVWLEVNQQLVAAEALYSRCGFRQTGPTRKFADGRVMRGWVRPA